MVDTQRQRRVEAVATAERCGKCGEPLGPDATVYRRTPSARPEWTVGFAGIPLCEGCAPDWNVKQQVMKYTRYEVPVERPCGGCGRPVVFVAHTTRPGHVPVPNSVYCSDRCRESARKQRQRVGPHERVCEVCGEEFTAKRADAKTCSPACRQRAHRQRLRA